MNLFVAGWRLTPEHRRSASAALSGLAARFPQVDPQSMWQWGGEGAAFLASCDTGAAGAAPRRYRVWDARQACLFAGLPVFPAAGGYAAHDAGQLALHWDHLAGELEGQYAVIKATSDPDGLALVTDFLGMEQVYVGCRGDAWLISNSVEVIAETFGSGGFDPLGVSLYLGIGWVGGDRTLRKGITVVPGGQRWTWQGGRPEPRRETLYAPADLARRAHERRGRVDAGRLAGELSDLCGAVGRDFDVLEAPLTAGRDSRLLAALLLAADVPALYYTSGDPASADVRLGSQIAAWKGLRHKVITIRPEQVVDAWDELVWDYVRRYDGMSSLWQIADMLAMPDQVDRLVVTFWGAGGEIARSFYGEPVLWLQGAAGKSGVQHYLARKLMLDHGGLLRRSAEQLVGAYVHDFVNGCLQAGFSPLDAPDLFYTYQRIGRWAGNNARKTAPVCDHFSPYCSRAFVEATFALSPLQRFTEPLHYRMLQALAPDLHALPFEKGPWRRQGARRNWLELAARGCLRGARGRIRRVVSGSRAAGREQAPKRAKAFDHGHWLEAKLPEIRAVCLDQPSSALWQYVDREIFEGMTASTTPPADRARHNPVLYAVATLFYYQAAMP